jgi:uncharacterized protein GlcG (DUF336 family)
MNLQVGGRTLISRGPVFLLLLVAALILSGGVLFAQEAEQIPSVPTGCAALPSHAELRAALQEVVAMDNAGLGFDMWAVTVNRDGEVCNVAFSGEKRDDQWLVSRVIAAQKAYTANGLSLPQIAISTANLHNASQPGASLYGVTASNLLDTDAAYGGSAEFFGQPNDPMSGKRAGGIIVFGGGLGFYDEDGVPVGAIGVSGDTACTDHIIAWRTRDALGLDNIPGGVSPTGDDNIIFDPASGYGHPECGAGEVEISATLPETLGPNE